MQSEEKLAGRVRDEGNHCRREEYVSVVKFLIAGFGVIHG